jgi:hypothetical protein
MLTTIRTHHMEHFGGRGPCGICAGNQVVYRICMRCNRHLCIGCIASQARQEMPLNCQCGALLETPVNREFGPLNQEETHNVDDANRRAILEKQIDERTHCVFMVCLVFGAIFTMASFLDLPIWVQVILSVYLFAHGFLNAAPCIFATLDVTYIIYVLCTTNRPAIIALGCVAMLAAAVGTYAGCRRTIELAANRVVVPV